MGIEMDLCVTAARQVPAAQSDGTGGLGWRGGRYGEGYVLPLMPSPHLLSDEGSYFVATNPTPGTGVAFAVNAAVSETAGYFLHLKNNDTPTNARGKRIYPHYLRLICAAAPASATAAHAFLKADIASRYSSGGSAVTPVNANLDTNAGTVAQLYAGALVTAAASQSARLVGRAVLRSAIPVVNDEWYFAFGAADAAGSAGGLGGAAAQRLPVPCPPVVLGPQDNLGLQLWFPGNATTPASFEFEMGWWER